MTNAEAVNWLINITADIGKAEHSDLWHYEQALSEIREMLEDAQPRHYHEENLLTYAHDMGVTLEQAEKELTRVTHIAPQRKPGKTLAEEVERIKRELTDIFTEQMSVQPQRIKGRWIEDGYNHYKAVCSECGEPCGTYVMGKPRDRFCKWCGADMRGDTDEV